MRYPQNFRLSVAERLIVSITLSTLLTGCQTTGNPREGGLFGWSEEKARERQAVLEAETNAARKTADAELQRGAVLSKQQSHLHAEVNELQANLARLLAENNTLDGQIRALMSTRKMSATELSRLRQTLTANKRARAIARLVATQEPSNRMASQISAHSETVGQYNRQLQREVLLLMGR
jgi:uncharacterized protein YdcH (DUF465 family)